MYRTSPSYHIGRPGYKVLGRAAFSRNGEKFFPLEFWPHLCYNQQAHQNKCTVSEERGWTMILISCIDDRGGLLFHGRRLSRDRVLCQDVLRTCAGSPLWMAPGSRSLFSSLRDGLSSSILTSEDFLAQAAPGEFCFLEDRPIRPFLDRVESMVLYHWNRRYPADLFLDLDPAALGWSLLGREEFPGSSHKKITKEVYRP